MMTLKFKKAITENEKPELSDYRKHLITAEQKSQEDFDKTVLSLSAGALGISFVFLKDVIGPNQILKPDLLFGAWIAWGMSNLCVLFSYYLSQQALRKAIQQTDSNVINNEKPGGWYSVATAILNPSGAILFFVGVCSITLFANANLKNKETPIGSTQSNTIPATIGPKTIPTTNCPKTISSTGC